MEILELKDTVTEIKSPVHGFTIRMKRREERISELEDRTVEISQYENREQIDWLGGGSRINRTSGTC